jgi:aminomethyltransferase
VSETATTLKRTPLHALHVELGARMVPFAGYEMPVQYKAGIIAEHKHCRGAAVLFDVSHMGQIRLTGADAAATVEALTPCDVSGAGEGRLRYTLFTNEAGGIRDDLMVTRHADHLFVIVNAACKDADFAHLQAHLRGDTRAEMLDDLALLALQGPQAAVVLARLAPGADAMKFMTAEELTIAGVACRVSRSGYSGEDGYEISVPAERAVALARALLAEPEVAPAGLGARDSLRLEAGLCLYGHDIDESTTPVEAGLSWTLHKRRRAEGGFPGAATILAQLADGPARCRVGLLPEGRAPVREGVELIDEAGTVVGRVTSGGFAPSLERPIALGYLPRALAERGQRVRALVRGSERLAEVCDLPFVKPNYHRG